MSIHCTKQCGHVDIVQSYLKHVENTRGTSQKIFVIRDMFDYLSECNCSRLYCSKKFMDQVQYKLDILYTNELEAFEKVNVDMCPYAIKMFGDHILNCKCKLQKCTRSGKKY